MVSADWQGLAFLVLLFMDNELLDEWCSPTGNLGVWKRWTDGSFCNQKTILNTERRKVK
jgi:hypothetical protein